jgi:uncharacterized protein
MMSKIESFEQESKRIKVAKSGIHGLGVFAEAPMEAGERILPYLGAPLGRAQAELARQRGNPFLLALPDGRVLDGSVAENVARFVNHSCQPCAELRIIDGKPWIVARESIGIAREITMNYGYDLDQMESLPCGCGSQRCVGYMVAEEYHPLVRLLYKIQKANLRE